ncbi:hypothetical protein EDE05_12849 [Neorhizobium sp. R1-B]|uniref:hypothetical protein n=1 Tax=Neorhizobium sp. R1-B TaxID=2485162 RepID=UPI001066A8FB|nr:hypothetical protein [Neorhizobium sp. R1-B]TDX72628.1 hypothetical protein EDE05_12849 [Neorhizobium sp. R1-B]
MSEAVEALARSLAEQEGWRWDDENQMLDVAAAGWQKTNRERLTWRKRAELALSSSLPTQHQNLSAEDTAIAICEACGKHIQEGEPYLWGPETSLCSDCAPTYQALLDEPEGFVNADGDPLTPEQCRAWYDEHIAAGGKATDSMAKVDRPLSTPPPVHQMRGAADAYVAEQGIEHSGGIIEAAFEAGALWASRAALASEGSTDGR